MGLKDVLNVVDINEGLEEYKKTPGAILVDVRTPDEYASGHISGSINIPLQNITKVEEKIADKEAPIFVYCFSGARSKRTANFLGKIGYENVKNIGGVAGYKGNLVK